MRRIFALLCLAPLACPGQEKSEIISEYIYDLNGHMINTGYAIAVSGSSKDSTTVEKGMSLNGRMVPRQAVEEKVLRDDKAGRIVERLIRRYDANGNPGPPEKVRIEETRNPDGSARTVTTVSRADINGNLQLAEREVTLSRTNPAGVTASTTVERPGVDGALGVTERRESVTKKTPAGSDSEVSTFRRDVGGQFYEAVRQVAQTAVRNNEATSNLTQYQARDGKLELEGRTVTNTRKDAAGAEVSVVEVYGVAAGGQVRVPGQTKLLEQDIIERKSGVETLSVRLTSPNDPSRLGPARKVRERTCTGDCK